jgi:hypothetical protein
MCDARTCFKEVCRERPGKTTRTLSHSSRPLLACYHHTTLLGSYRFTRAHTWRSHICIERGAGAGVKPPNEIANGRAVGEWSFQPASHLWPRSLPWQHCRDVTDLAVTLLQQTTSILKAPYCTIYLCKHIISSDILV